MPRMKAKELLAEGNLDPTDHEAIYQITLTATGSIEAAKRAQTQAMKALVNAKTGSEL